MPPVVAKTRSYSINFTQLKLISVLSQFSLLVSGILLFIVTFEQCIHRRSISIHSNYVIHDVIVYAAKWLYCMAPDPCGLGRNYLIMWSEQSGSAAVTWFNAVIFTTIIFGLCLSTVGA